MKANSNQRFVLNGLAVIGALALSGCGPTEAEIGAMLTSACLPLLLLGVSIQFLYRWAWVRLGQSIEFSLRPTVIAFVLTFLINIPVVARLGVPSDDWWVVAIVGGTSFLTVFLIALRIAIHLNRGYSSAVWWPFAYTAIPAALLGLFGSHSTDSDWVMILLLPGGLGYGFIGVFVFLAVELALRTILHRRKKRKRAAEFPPARVRR